MQIPAANPIDSLREWGEICREFACSENQVRELYSAPCPEAATAAESYEDVMVAFGLQFAQQQQQAVPVFFERKQRN
jgi:hypothetical protein